jgi:hypothetical protein
MPQYAISAITGISPEGTLDPPQFADHLSASPWQPVTIRDQSQPWEAGPGAFEARDWWRLDFTLRVGDEAVRGRLGPDNYYLVLDGSIEAVSRIAVWYRGIVAPAYHLALREYVSWYRAWIDLTPEMTAAEISRALTARLRPARSTAGDLAARRRRVVERRQARLASALDESGVPATSLTVLHDTGSEVIFGLAETGATALATWSRLRDAVSLTRHWPVLLGEWMLSSDVLSDLERDQARAVSDILRVGLSLDPQLIFPALARVEPGPAWREWEGDVWGEEARWPWPDEGTVWQRESRFAGESAATPVDLALVPTQHSWEVPAILRWGGFNACPGPEQQVAILKYWQGRYGAEVLTVLGDGLELRAERLPASREEALMLAREHLAYCSDIDQGGYSIEDLAKLLLVSPIWTFWWD